MTPSPERRPEETDLELINRWKAGDGRAATQLVGRHSQALARFAASAGEREGIEELVQDTFVRAFASIDSFRGESSLRTWLFTIERRLMLDRRRAERSDGCQVLHGAIAAARRHQRHDRCAALECGID